LLNYPCGKTCFRRCWSSVQQPQCQMAVGENTNSGEMCGNKLETGINNQTIKNLRLKN